MKKVVLHVYDVTNSASPKTNNTILHINKIFKDAIGLGGIFHSAVQVYGDEEWSFGFCETGSGVFSCPPTRNPMYTYRESIVLGETDSPNFSVNQILRELSREWPGTSYDLLSKNCNHFCDEFCEKLGVPKLPAWVNRFANAGDAAMEVAGNTALRWHGGGGKTWSKEWRMFLLVALWAIWNERNSRCFQNICGNPKGAFSSARAMDLDWALASI